jgi:hypothetical protein
MRDGAYYALQIKPNEEGWRLDLQRTDVADGHTVFQIIEFSASASELGLAISLAIAGLAELRTRLR